MVQFVLWFCSHAIKHPIRIMGLSVVTKVYLDRLVDTKTFFEFTPEVAGFACARSKFIA